MDFTPVLQDIKNSGFAAKKYEQQGHRKFRDLIIISYKGKAKFERYCYGEAASLVFALRALQIGEDGRIQWENNTNRHSYAGQDIPQQLTGYQNGALCFDGKNTLWEPIANYKTMGKAGLSRFKTLF